MWVVSGCVVEDATLPHRSSGQFGEEALDRARTQVTVECDKARDAVPRLGIVYPAYRRLTATPESTPALLRLRSCRP
jgi:hypothetical protein